MKESYGGGMLENFVFLCEMFVKFQDRRHVAASGSGMISVEAVTTDAEKSGPSRSVTNR